MNRELVNALSDCLARIEEGMPIEDALAMHAPEVRAQLAPLVAGLLAVQDLPLPAVRPAFRIDLQAALQAESARLEAGSAQRRSRWPNQVPGTVIVVALVLFGSLFAVRLAVQGGSEHLTRTNELESAQPATGAAPAATVVNRVSMPGMGMPGVGLSGIGDHLSAPVSPPIVPINATPTIRATVRAVARGLRTAEDAPNGLIGIGAGPGSTPAGGSADEAQVTPPSVDPSPEDEGDPGDHAVDPPTATPLPLPTSTAMLPGGTGVLRGHVVQGDGTQSVALAGVIVELYADSSIDCATNRLGPPARQSTTDVDGGFEIAGLPAGFYRVASLGGALCLPRRWHVGPNELGASGACDGALSFELREGMAVGSINVRYAPAEVLGCKP